MSTERLATLIDARLQVLVQLLALARHQSLVIDDSDLSTLMKVLAGKQQLVSELVSIDRELQPYQQQSPESRSWASIEARDRCRHQAARCEAVLREILAAERQAESLMIAQRAATADRLAALNQSGQAHRAYVQSPVLPASGALDLTSEG